MGVEIITREDLNVFGATLLESIKEILQLKTDQSKQWLRSAEVRKLLSISPGTLQTLRINKIVSYSWVGGIIYYDRQDIEKLLEQNKVSSERRHKLLTSNI